jgi:hypothetical protein
MIYKFSILFLVILNGIISAQFYPDQHYVVRIDSIFQNIETNEGLKLSDDGKSILLKDSVTNGYIILKPQYSQSPFNEGLPSWNGTALDNNSSFKVQMRFPYNGGWSPWLTVGFWKANIWSSYGSTSYGGGYIDYDTAKLLSYQSSWQFKIIMTRTSISIASPTLHKLSFFVSDTRTTTSIDYNQILNDNPEQIFIPTDFIYQYGVDPQIGGSICSPTSVSMILRSYDIQVDPYQFALDTYDPYFEMFGIWPRVVQNACEYGLNGAVTRYRTWSEAREVLANGGRISMSIGEPLYTGHLVMLAGFTSDGRPIVHDPARSNGYSYIYNKSSISHSWFDKGGVAYTFYKSDSVSVFVENEFTEAILADNFKLYQNYPNPFNPITSIQYTMSTRGFVQLKIYDILGIEVETLVDEEKPKGNYQVNWNAVNLPSGIYFYQLKTVSNIQTRKMTLLK